jgi:hypothetical protein
MQRVHFVRIVSGNRITLPEDLRLELKFHVGDYLRLEWTDKGEITITPVDGHK